jgi:hypothetical protein
MSLLPLFRTLFALAIAASLIGGGIAPAMAQGDVPSEDETSQVEQEAPVLGWLQISAVSCSAGGEPGTVAILLAFEYAPQGECTETAIPLLIDGFDYGPVAPYLELQVEAGFHSLYEPTSGAARDVEVPPDGATQVVLVSFSAPVEEPTPEPVEAAEVATTGLTVVAHSCKPEIQSVDQLWGLGGVTDRLNACPAMTLPGYPSPGGTVNGGEHSFDFTLSPTAGEAQSLSGNGTFMSDSFCESGVGALDNDPTNDRCVSNSGFAFELPDGPATMTLTVVPELMRYVAAETGSGADAGVITGSDSSAWYLGLDTTLRGTEQPVIHLYFLNPPRVNVVMHLCGNEIGSPDDLNSHGSLASQLLTCPAVARMAEGGSADFGVSVSDATWGTRDLNSANFDPTVVCESDIGDWNGNGGDNACVDAPTYRFPQTALGYVSVALDYAPAGYVFGGANSADGVITGVDTGSWAISLDTTYDGDVTIHLFAIPAAPPTATATTAPTQTNTPVPPSPTATRTPTATATSPAPSQTPTRTATVPSGSSTPTPTQPTGSTTGNGTLTIVALYCLTSSGTSVVALNPGVAASPSDLGGSSCFAGDASIRITLASGEAVPVFKLGRDGVESLQNLPATTNGLHTLSEQLTGQSATFAIEPGTVTRVIVKYGAGTALIDEGVTSSGSTAGGSGGNGSTSSGGLVTDELIGDEGAIYSNSFSGISFTSLVVEDVDAQAVSSVKDAKSLPGVGTGTSTRQSLGLLVAMCVLVLSAGFGAWRLRTR